MNTICLVCLRWVLTHPPTTARLPMKESGLARIALIRRRPSLDSVGLGCLIYPGCTPKFSLGLNVLNTRSTIGGGTRCRSTYFAFTGSSSFVSSSFDFFACFTYFCFCFFLLCYFYFPFFFGDFIVSSLISTCYPCISFSLFGWNNLMILYQL